MTDSIYKDIILEHYRYPQNQGRISNPSATIQMSNPLCGDTITLDVLFEGDKIKDIKYEAKGCAISIASASILSEEVIGKNKEEVSKVDIQRITELLGINLSFNRLKCATLPLQALEGVIKI